MAQVVKEGKNTKRELLKELDMIRHKNAEIDREKEDLRIQLTVQNQAQQKLTIEVSVWRHSPFILSVIWHSNFIV